MKKGRVFDPKSQSLHSPGTKAGIQVVNCELMTEPMTAASRPAALLLNRAALSRRMSRLYQDIKVTLNPYRAKGFARYPFAS
jgi:hypothetical protein